MVALTIPTHRALCVPDGTRLRIETPRRAGIRCLYLDAGLGVLGDAVRVVNLTSLTRELTLHAVAAAPMDLTVPADAAIITLLAEQLAFQPGAPLHLPMPDGPSRRDIAEAIMSNPADPVREQLRAANANRRTIERRFNTETAMSLGKWRRRSRILASIASLADGERVTNVAVTVGYSTPSPFVAGFRAEPGTSPRDTRERDQRAQPPHTLARP